MQMVTVSRGDAFITFYPSDTLKVSCGVDHAAEAPIIGRQWFSWAPFQDDHYRWVIAPAKAFYKSMKVLGAAASWTPCMKQDALTVVPLAASVPQSYSV